MTHVRDITACEDCRPTEDALTAMEEIALGEREADDELCSEHFLEFEKSTCDYAVGTRDLTEADRRFAVLDEWLSE